MRKYLIDVFAFSLPLIFRFSQTGKVSLVKMTFVYAGIYDGLVSNLRS